MKRTETCCFTGHRDIAQSEKRVLFENTLRTVRDLYAKGYREFICGGAVGFDQLAEDVLLVLKKEYADIRLHLYLPCENQDRYFDEEQKAKYRLTRELADSVTVLYPHYVRGCMHTRNRRMVDASSVCITYIRKDTGGSVYTASYAEKQGVTVIDL